MRSSLVYKHFVPPIAKSFMQEFDYQLRTRIISGPSAVSKLGDVAKGLGGKKVLVVSDPGVLSAGIFAAGCESLHAAGLDVQGFHDLRENPTTHHIRLGVAAAKQFAPDLIVGLGGGSSMDCAKGINFIYSCGGEMKDYWGVGKATAPMLPMIAIPTTAGTGSETQSFALISDEQTHVKMACGDPKAACRVAILDPLLTLTQPKSVTALTGIDAITHALETYVSTKRNPMSECYSREAWQLLSRGFANVISNPTNVESREQMQLGACFAGMAIEASMLGAGHALANPLTSTFGVPHGQAVGMMMPHVVRFNGQVVEDRYEELASTLDKPSLDALIGNSDLKGSAIIAELVTCWLRHAGLSTNLRQIKGWPEATKEKETLELLAINATKQWTGAFNPRSVTYDCFLDMYRAAL